jgi:hypothetical protein
MRENNPICPLNKIACGLDNNCRYLYLEYSEANIQYILAM